MQFVRLLRQVKLVSPAHGAPGLGLRGARSAAHVPREDSDTPLHMDDPYRAPAKGCVLCRVPVDYKNVQLLSQFVSPHTGRIYGRHITGLCGQKQKEISRAIKKAHAIGFMSVTHKHPQLMRDPSVCGVKLPD